MDDNVELNFEFNLNSPQAKKEAEDIKKSIDGASDSAEELGKKVKKGVDKMVESGKQASGSFDGLQNSINQITRELPAFTYSAQTGFMAISNNIPTLVDQINQIRKANAELEAQGKKTVPVWKQVAGAFFSWNTLMSVGITLLTVYGKEIGNFIIALFKGKAAIDQAKESIKMLNKAIESTDFSRAIVNVNELKINIDLAKRGLIDKMDVLEHYNNTIGNTTGQVKSLDEAEKALARNAKNYVQMTIYKTAANLALQEAATKAMEVEKTRLKKESEFRNMVADARVSTGGSAAFGTGAFNAAEYQKETERISQAQKKRKEALLAEQQKAMDDELKVAQSLQEKAARISKKNGFDFYGDAGADSKASTAAADKAKREHDQAVAIRKDMLEKVAKLDQEYSAKSFSKDEAELQALRNKFAEFRRIVIEANAKLAEYNRTHPIKVELLDIRGLDPIEKRATDATVYRQQTDHFKTELDRQKKLWEDYEDYKTALGAEKAKKRFSTELNVQQSFLKQLQTNYAITVAQGTVGGFDGPVKERMFMLQALIDIETKAEKDKQDKLVQSLISYNDQRKQLILNYENDLKAVSDTATADELANLDRLQKEKLDKLDDAHIQQLGAYKALFLGIEHLSDKQAKKVVGDARVMLDALVKSGQISAEMYKRIRDRLDQTQSAVASKLPEKLIGLAGQLDQVAQAVSGINEQFGGLLSTLGAVVGQVGNIRKGMADFKAFGLKGDALGQLGSGLSIVTAGMSVFQAVYKLFDRSAQREAQAAYSRELQAKQTDALNKSLERQVQLINEAYGVERLKKYSEALQQATENQAKFTQQLSGRYQLTGDSSIDKFITKLNNGERFFDDQRIKESLQRAGVLKEVGSSLGIEELTRLIDEGRLDANTANIVSNLIAAKKAAVDLANQLKAEAVGSSLDSIADKFINDLLDSSVTAGKSITEIIQKSVLNGFKGELIRTQLQAFYDRFAELSKDGLTNDELAELTKTYTDAFENARKKLADLEKATGISMTDPGKGTGVAAKIQDAITESTGSEIVGATRAAYEMSKRNLEATKEGTAVQRESMGVQSQMLDVLKEQLTIQQQIATNTQNTTQQLEAALVQLKDINKNTKPQGARALT